jgi:hypothetical protein
MTVYWLLFAYAAVMALFFPLREQAGRLGPVLAGAIWLFIVAYVAMAGLRHGIGGDWDTYDDIYDEIAISPWRQALQVTDPGFSLLVWLSSLAGWGIYPVNAVCAGLLALGVARVALGTREPWLAILASVPYLLIVVGMGYVRQAGAIGLMLLALDALGRNRRAATIILLGGAAAIHATSGILFPLYGQMMVRGRPLLRLALAALGVAAFLYLLADRFDKYELGYIENAYDSAGAAVRLTMSALPSLLLLARWRYFPVTGPARGIWLGLALANMAAVVALELSPSSTAVDRLGLYFSPVQVVVFGSLLDLVPLPRAATYLARILVIALAGAVQLVWLVLATNASAWVPYHWILERW